MIRSHYRPAALFLCLGASFATAQTPTTTTMPKDPAALMQLAAQVNGLDTPGMKPWHIKLTYQTYDSDGKPKDQGTFEEWWAAPDKDKRVYTSPSFNQTDYITSTGKFRVGDENGPPLAEFLVRERLVDPMPAAEDTDGATARKRDSVFPKSKLTCVELERPIGHESIYPGGLFPTYCFDETAPMLRFSGSVGLLNTLYQKVGQLDGHYLGTSFEITDVGKPFVSAQLVAGNLLANTSDADFAPPPSAIELPKEGIVKTDANILAGRKIKGSIPVYPVSAKQARIEGTVTISALIGEDGHIRQLRVLSAPDPSLALSAIMAVRDWTYTPYQLNGRPVEISTTLKVMYQMAR